MGAAVSTTESLSDKLTQRGGANSSLHSSGATVAYGTGGKTQQQITEEFAVSLVLPIYYMKAKVTPEEMELAIKMWKSIINNRAEHFLAIKKQHQESNTPFSYNMCSDYFADTFYQRLFDIHSRSKDLFSGTKMKMRMYFMGAITVILESLLDDPEKCVKMLENLAKVHNHIGVKAVEYGIGCEVLMYCIKKCVGEAEYTPKIANIFTKVFSRVLDVIVPVVVRYELELNRAPKNSTDSKNGTKNFHVVSTQENSVASHGTCPMHHMPPTSSSCPSANSIVIGTA